MRGHILALAVSLAPIALAITPDHAIAQTQAFQPTYEDGVARRGQDYRSFKPLGPSALYCQQACLTEPQCRAWGYDSPSVTRDRQPVCWLKSSVPPPANEPGIVSGVVRPDPAGASAPASAEAQSDHTVGGRFAAITPDLAKAHQLNRTSGVLIVEAFKNSPLEQAGVRTNDVVLAIDGVPVNDIVSFATKVGLTPIGQQVVLTLDRGGATENHSVTVARCTVREPGPGALRPCQAWDSPSAFEATVTRPGPAGAAASAGNAAGEPKANVAAAPAVAAPQPGCQTDKYTFSAVNSETVSVNSVSTGGAPCLVRVAPLHPDQVAFTKGVNYTAVDPRKFRADRRFRV
jgi:hypothetical protein